MGSARIRKRVEQVASLFGLGASLATRAADLDPFEARLVGIARLAARQPVAYLLDEPFAGFDARDTADFRAVLHTLHAETGATVICAMPDEAAAMAMSCRIGLLSEGRLIQAGSARALYEEPESVQTARLFGQPPMNIFDRGLIPVTGLPRGATHVGARGEHLILTPSRVRGRASGDVEAVRQLGADTLLHVRFKEQLFVLRAGPEDHYRPGDRVSLRLNKPLFFNAEGQRLRK